MNRKKIIIIIVFILLAIAIVAWNNNKTKAQSKNSTSDNTKEDSYDNITTISDEKYEELIEGKDQTVQTIRKDLLIEIAEELHDIFWCGTFDSDRERVIEIFKQYFKTRQDVLALIEYFDRRWDNEKDFLSQYKLAMARDDKYKYNVKVNLVLRENGVDYQFNFDRL